MSRSILDDLGARLGGDLKRGKLDGHKVQTADPLDAEKAGSNAVSSSSPPLRRCRPASSSLPRRWMGRS